MVTSVSLSGPDATIISAHGFTRHRSILPFGLKPAREKSRLTVDYLSYSFSFFRQARADCAAVFNDAEVQGYKQVVVAGVSDLAEIARICALESGIDIIAIVDANAAVRTFVGVPVVASFDEVTSRFDAVVVTDLRAAREAFDLAAACVGTHRVLAPKLLGLRFREEAAE
jgi:hypothetical protein